MKCKGNILMLNTATVDTIDVSVFKGAYDTHTGASNPHSIAWSDVSDGHTSAAHNSISVTDLSDVTNAGSGIIISAAERTKVGYLTVTGNIDLDALSTANHTHTNKTILDNTTASYTTAEETKVGYLSVTSAVDLDTLASNTHTHTNKTVLDNITASYTTAEETKLSGIEALADVTDATNVAAAGALMSVNLLDEDTMASNSSTQPATQQSIKSYIDAVASGLSIKQSPVAASTAPISATYDNGTAGVGATLTNSGTQEALVMDGITAQQFMPVLIKDQNNLYENGLYNVTEVGDGSTNWVLERQESYDTSDDITDGSFFFVQSGTVNGDNGFVQTNDPITIGTDPITFSQFSGAGQISPGVGLSKSGNTININLGAGIKELPTDEVGIDVYATGGLITTVDGSSSSTVTGAQLAILLNGSTLNLSASGLKVSDGTYDDAGTAASAVGDHAALATSHGVSGTLVGTSDTQTLSAKTLTSPVLNGTLSGTAFLDEDQMTSDSAIAVASQQSIKAYVDGVSSKLVESATAAASLVLVAGSNALGYDVTSPSMTGLYYATLAMPSGFLASNSGASVSVYAKSPTDTYYRMIIADEVFIDDSNNLITAFVQDNTDDILIVASFAM